MWMIMQVCYNWIEMHVACWSPCVCVCVCVWSKWLQFVWIFICECHDMGSWCHRCESAACDEQKSTRSCKYLCKCAAFFLNSAQRSPGRFDSDGRSCVVGRAQHSPFVSTTMQVQEGGDVIVKEEDMWASPIFVHVFNQHHIRLMKTPVTDSLTSQWEENKCGMFIIAWMSEHVWFTKCFNVQCNENI